MQTSASGTRTDRSSRARAAGGAGGFTLLELLVVMMIIGLLAGAVILSTGAVREERDIEREAMRLRSLIVLLREEALMQSREHAVLFGESGYRFYIYDYQQERWVDPPGDSLLAPYELAPTIGLELRVEERDLVLAPAAQSGADDDASVDDAPQPQVMILSSGETTPFQAAFFRDFRDGRITLTAELDGTLTIGREGFDGP